MKIAKREALAAKRQMGCPDQLAYPLDSAKRIRSAMQYYRHKRTVKCREFWGNWCRRAKAVGLTHYPTFQLKCTKKGKAKRKR